MLAGCQGLNITLRQKKHWNHVRRGPGANKPPTSATIASSAQPYTSLATVRPSTSLTAGPLTTATTPTCIGATVSDNKLSKSPYLEIRLHGGDSDGVQGVLDLSEYEGDIVSVVGEGAKVLEISGLSAAL